LSSLLYCLFGILAGGGQFLVNPFEVHWLNPPKSLFQPSEIFFVFLIFIPIHQFSSESVICLKVIQTLTTVVLVEKVSEFGLLVQ
jgi:hypothetical protein